MGKTLKKNRMKYLKQCIDKLAERERIERANPKAMASHKLSVLRAALVKPKVTPKGA